jgi:hypothetical protein
MVSGVSSKFIFFKIDFTTEAYRFRPLVARDNLYHFSDYRKLNIGDSYVTMGSIDIYQRVFIAKLA